MKVKKYGNMWGRKISPTLIKLAHNWGELLNEQETDATLVAKMPLENLQADQWGKRLQRASLPGQLGT